NPLFVEQVVRAGGPGVPPGPDGPAVGAHRVALLAALTARLERTDPDVVDLLATLAVLGPRAGAEAATVLLGAPPGTVEPVIRRARSAGLVEPDGWSLSHPLVAEALVTLIPEGRLDALHLAASQLGVDGGLAAAERAHHLCRAGPDHWMAAVEACCE